MFTIRNFRFFNYVVIFLTLVAIMAFYASTGANAMSLGGVNGQTSDVSTPIQVILTIDHYPASGESVQLKCEITTAEEAPNSTAQIELPAGGRLIDGSLTWNGDLHPNQPVQLLATVAFDQTGDTSVFCRAHYQIDEQNSWGDLGQLYFNIGTTQGAQGFAEIPLNAQISNAVMLEAGDGTPVDNAANTFTPDLNAPPPPAVDAQQSAAPANEPNAPQGNLTITGVWHYYDRNDNWASEEMLVEVVQGDNGNHLAWCYTGLDGSYSCGPFTNPGAVGVRSIWRSYIKYNPYFDILATENPDWSTATPADVNAAYPVSTDVEVFSDGTHDIGSWYILNGNDYERAYWCTTDLIRAWKYIFFGPGIGSTPVETTGSGTVQWKMSSTDGTYYNYGGNIHLTGADPLSNTVVNHEYGHNVMWNIYGGYFPNNDCISPHYIQKIGGPHCGWTEGWADFFPMAINNDPFYRWASGSTLNLETPTWGTPTWDNGEQVEGRVAGALWDILDNVNDGDDTYTDGNITNIWDTFKHHATDDHFNEYWAGWLARGHNNTSAGPIMDLYQNTINYRSGPSNDDFANSFGISGGTSSWSEYTTNATTQGLDPITACGSSGRQARSVWFTYNPTTTRQYFISTRTSNYDTVLAIWTGSWGSLSSVGCSDDFAGTFQSALTQALTHGTNYYIEAMGFGDGNTGGELYLYVCYAPDIPVLSAPANDLITNVNTPSFTWSTVNTPDSSQIQIATLANMSGLVIDTTTTSNTYTPGSPLADGNYYWRVRGKYTSGCTNDGNWSEIRHFVLDTVKPTGTIVVNSGAVYANSTSVNLTLAATDAGSGMSQMQFSNDGSSWSGWEAYATSKSWSLTGGDGVKTVYVQYRDVAGNVSSNFTDTIALDTIVPSGSVSINAGAAATNLTSVNLTLAATDAGSGVSQLQFSNDGSSWSGWEAYNTSKAWTLTGGDGTKTVYVQYSDVAGNVSSSFTDTIVLDTTAPSSYASSPAQSVSLSFTVSWTGSDATSGVAYYDVQYRVDTGGTWTNWLTHTSETSAIFGTTSPVVVVRGETYYFRVRADDLAGNAENYPGGDGDTSTYIGSITQVFLPFVFKP